MGRVATRVQSFSVQWLPRNAFGLLNGLVPVVYGDGQDEGRVRSETSGRDKCRSRNQGVGVMANEEKRKAAAMETARRIMADCTNRRGLRQAIDSVDDDIRQEILEEWAEIILKNAVGRR